MLAAFCIISKMGENEHFTITMGHIILIIKSRKCLQAKTHVCIYVKQKQCVLTFCLSGILYNFFFLGGEGGLTWRHIF